MRSRPKLKAEKLGALLRDVELPLARVIADMETTGMRLDKHVLESQSKACGL